MKDLQNLAYLPAGSGANNAPDLFDSARMRQLMAEWRESFDEVIVNLPRLNVHADAGLVSTLAEAVQVFKLP